MCAHSQPPFFKKILLRSKKITAAFSFERDKREKASKLNLPIVILLFFYSSTFFSTSGQKGANDHTSNSLAMLCRHKADAFG